MSGELQPQGRITSLTVKIVYSPDKQKVSLEIKNPDANIKKINPDGSLREQIRTVAGTILPIINSFLDGIENR